MLLAGVILLAAAVYLVLRMTGTAGSFAVVYTDGAESARFPLSEDRQVTLAGYDGGFNVLVIEDGGARMTDADCPDLTCVHEGRIDTNGQSIICLPHRIVVTVEGGEAAEVDAVAE